LQHRNDSGLKENGQFYVAVVI